MQRYRFIGIAFIVLMGFVYHSTLAKDMKETKVLTETDDVGLSSETIRAGEKKICINISLENTDLASRDSIIAEVRITNCSDLSLSVSDFRGIIFSFSKNSFENGSRVVRGEVFQSGFSIKQFKPIAPFKEIPSELKSKDYFEFKIDLAKGVWEDTMSSDQNLSQGAGLGPVPGGRYYLSAEIRSPASSEGEEGHAFFRSNEIEVTF